MRAVLFLFISYALISCKKGDTGPAGPAGSTNVVYSDWFTPPSYIKDTIFGTWGFDYNKAVTEITQQVIDSGAVITFGKLDGYVTSVWPTNQVAPLPILITYMDGSSPNIDTWSAYLTPGNLRINLVSSLNAYGSISNAHQFRYVIIPSGGTKNDASVQPGLISASGKQPDASALHVVVQNYKQMSYAEICQRLGIPE
jgi:hypothetical protein